MTQYTTTAFRWSGTGYNAQYNTSYTAVLDDNDAAYQGSADGDETISINGGAFGATAGSPYAIDVSFVDTANTPHVETFYFFNTGGAWYFIPGPGSAFTVGATLGSYQNHTVGWNYADVICFTPGVRLVTPRGMEKVENLRIGDLVITRDNGLQAIRWVGRKVITGARLFAQTHLRPVRIRKDAFGPGLPCRDMMVSPQHRMLVSSPETVLHFDAKEVLVPAKSLVNGHSVVIEQQCERTEYIHILFDNHEIVTAEGLPTESFHPGAMGLDAIKEASRDELFEIFPELRINPKSFGPSARKILRHNQAQALLPQSPFG